MNPNKSLIDGLKKLVGSFSKEGGLPVSPAHTVNRTFIMNDELPEVAEELALYNSGYMADKSVFNLSVVPYKQKFVV